MRGTATVVAVGLGLLPGCKDQARVPFPPPRPVVHAAEPRVADFVGADACASCHPAQYAAWRGSTHGRAGGTPGPGLVLAPFNGAPIRFADALVTASAVGGDYRFTIRREGIPDVVFRVDGVIGGGHMVGGGTQGFV